MEEEDFSTADAGAALTFPVRAGELGKGSYVVMNNKFPCKIIEYSTSKTGKHGHAKATFVALDIFTGRRYEDALPTSHNVDAPVVTRREWQLIGMSPDGYATLFDCKTGTTDASLTIPPPIHLWRNTADDAAAYEELIAALEARDKDVCVTVLTAMGASAIQPTLAVASAF